jgi:NAD(P)H-hydrate epimerase
MKILSPTQIKELDHYTIQNEPIKSIDLMERASNAFVAWFIKQFPDTEKMPIKIFCGPGNNGGDGLAVARLLNRKHYDVAVFVCGIGTNRSADFEKNLKRIPRRRGLPIKEINEGDSFPIIEEHALIIDAIFGSGLNRPVEGYWASLITYMNQLPNDIVAIDIPSGLFADRHTEGEAIEAIYTLTFELPKLAFFFPQNQNSVGTCFVQPIGLNKNFIEECTTNNFLVTKNWMLSFYKKRSKFDHKGTYGHALLIMGSFGKIGAAILATKACLRSGAGLTSVHSPRCAYEIMQISCPEAMASVDENQKYISTIPNLENYKAIGIGCGIDQQAITQNALFGLLKKAKTPLVLDADALNILAKNPAQLKNIPANSILTPHPKEFERLFGKTANDFERNELQRQKAIALNCIILLKGANSCIATPDGNAYFNATGNPGMATGGSGDVLTGIITGLLAQGYPPMEAAILGAYLHGLAGDLAATDIGQESLVAGDLINYLGKAFQAFVK